MSAIRCKKDMQSKEKQDNVILLTNGETTLDNAKMINRTTNWFL